MAEDQLTRRSGQGPEGPAHRTVVAALDGSPHEDAVVAWAAAAAVREGVRLDLVHVIELGAAITPYAVFATDVPWFGEQLEATTRDHLDVVAAGVRARHPGLAVDVRTPFGSPAAVLVELSETATVVVGASPHRGLERFVLGSTALAVAAHGHGSVVVVHGTATEPHVVVVGADGSEPSVRAVERALAAADRVGGRVVAVTAWSVEVQDGVVVTERGSDRWREVEARIVAATTASLADVAAEHPAVPLDVVARHGRPVEALVAVATELGADLVVVGRRGRGGFAGLHLGGVSRSVAQRSPVPVEVVA